MNKRAPMLLQERKGRLAWGVVCWCRNDQNPRNRCLFKTILVLWYVAVGAAFGKVDCSLPQLDLARPYDNTGAPWLFQWLYILKLLNVLFFSFCICIYILFILFSRAYIFSLLSFHFMSGIRLWQIVKVAAPGQHFPTGNWHAVVAALRE